MTRPDQLYRLLYRSRSALTGSDEAIAATLAGVLETSRRNNARDGITGALLFTSSMFIQALEGPLSTLEATFERICCDHRHMDVEVIEFAPVDARAFGEWSLERVHADASLASLFLQMSQGGASEVDVAAASAQAVSLMTTLIALGGEAPARSEAA